MPPASHHGDLAAVSGSDPPSWHPAARDGQRGAGIIHAAPFDLTDVLWWRELRLPARSLITRTGRMPENRVADGTPGAALRRPGGGQDGIRAREAIVAALRASATDGRRRPSAGELHERGEKPLGIVTTRQWVHPNGGRDADLNAELVVAR